MYRGPIAASLLVSVLATPASAAKEQLPLEPSSEWKVDHGHDQCSLSRHFGDQHKDLLLEITSFGSRTSFRFTLMGEPLPQFYSGSSLFLSLTPGAAEDEVRILRSEADNGPAIRFSAQYLADEHPDDKFKGQWSRRKFLEEAATPRSSQTALEEKSTVLLLKEDKWKQISLHTGEMAKPLASLRDCIDELETSWGLDPAKQKTLSRFAVPLPSTVKSIQGFYPSKMSFRGVSSYVPVRVMVDMNGNAGECIVPIDGVSAEFKEAVCDGLAKQFQPALDVEGRPVASAFITSVVFYRF